MFRSSLKVLSLLSLTKTSAAINDFSKMARLSTTSRNPAAAKENIKGALAEACAAIAVKKVEELHLLYNEIDILYDEYTASGFPPEKAETITKKAKEAIEIFAHAKKSVLTLYNNISTAKDVSSPFFLMDTDWASLGFVSQDCFNFATDQFITGAKATAKTAHTQYTYPTTLQGWLTVFDSTDLLSIQSDTGYYSRFGITSSDVKNAAPTLLMSGWKVFRKSDLDNLQNKLHVVNTNILIHNLEKQSKTAPAGSNTDGDKDKDKGKEKEKSSSNLVLNSSAMFFTYCLITAIWM